MKKIIILGILVFNLSCTNDTKSVAGQTDDYELEQKRADSAIAILDSVDSIMILSVTRKISPDVANK